MLPLYAADSTSTAQRTKLALVPMPGSCASRIPRFTSELWPKLSRFAISYLRSIY